MKIPIFLTLSQINIGSQVFPNFTFWSKHAPLGIQLHKKYIKVELFLNDSSKTSFLGKRGLI